MYIIKQKHLELIQLLKENNNIAEQIKVELTGEINDINHLLNDSNTNLDPEDLIDYEQQLNDANETINDLIDIQTKLKQFQHDFENYQSATVMQKFAMDITSIYLRFQLKRSKKEFAELITEKHDFLTKMKTTKR